MEAKNADSDTSAYQMVFSALDELEYGFLKSFFKTNVLEDDVLFVMKSEEDLRNVLTKDLGLAFGRALKFSRHWFKTCHKHKAPTESQVQSTEEKSSTSNGNNKLFPTTAIDGSQDEDGQECGIQGGTNLDQQTELPKKSPYSSKEKGEQNCKKQQRKQGEAQNETDPKRSFKGPIPHGTIDRESGKFENEPKESLGDSSLRNVSLSDRSNNSITERTSSAQSVGKTGSEKSNQSVEKVPSQDGCAGIENGPFSVPNSSSSSIPQDAGLPQISRQTGEANKQSSSAEGQDAKDSPSVQVSKCIGRPFGVKVTESNISYSKGFVLDAEENKEVEYKSFSSAQPSILPWKIMEKAKKFICACLNADSKGIIYFGVGDNQEQKSKFLHGEIIGLEVENIKDDITKALQVLLDNHIQSDDGPLQKGGEQNCINIHFVPVTCQGNRANLYVVEIEVSRDWRFCKDNVFHSKSWIEKSGGNKDFTAKRGLTDLFKVKDTWDDVAIRTKGASTCVKQHEVKRQVREPLETKYKEWKRETKLGANEFSGGHNPDDPDFKMCNMKVRERLFDVNIKEYHYILVANKVPPQYRGTPHLSFLQSIPWVAVFDLFDAASKKDGLYFICNETTDARRANVKTLDDFKNISSDWNASKDCPLTTKGTTWVLQLKQLQDEEWITCSAKDYFYRTLSAYKQYFPAGRLVIAILGLGENAVMEMSDIAESCFSILGGEIARKCVTIISESKNFSDALIKNSKPALRKQLKECSLTDISWDLLREIVREMVGPDEFMERGATTKLPYFTGQKEVLNKVIHSWDDLEVYCPEPRLPNTTEEIEKARNAFYKGTQASQINLFHDHTIERTLEQEIVQKIEQAVKLLSKPIPSSDRTSSVRTFTVPYEPGSGATTLCRRILWNKRKNYRCAVVKAVTKFTDFQIDQLQRIGYNEKRQNFSPPVLALLDNLSESDTRGLSERLITRETKCVIIATYPIQTTGSTVEFEMKPLRQLDENEMSHVRNILINITKDSGRRREAEEVLERERRFIWFGLELFGREYVKIKERLQNHIESTLTFLGDSHAIHEKLLYFCCFLHFFSNGSGILPHAFVVDVINESSDEKGQELARKTSIHDKFGGLLLEGFSESYGYHGWRPAHSLVSEVVKSRMNTGDIAVELLENAQRGKAYVNKFLREQLFQILLLRKRVSNLVTLPQEDEKPEDDIGPDVENEVHGIYDVRTRYSPLILDILRGENGNQRTLELLITVCQKANQTEDKAYAWQQLARFMAYEMRFKQLESTDAMHSRLYDAMILSKRNESQLPTCMPETGIKAAHIAVDIAIRLQPSYSHHYSTKGVLYVLQLRDVNTNDGHSLVSSIPDIIDMGRKALKVYDQAIQKMRGLNFYSVNGKIQVIVLLLKIVKSLPCFCLSENSSFTRYLEVGEIPQEMKELLQQEDHKFIQHLGQTTLQLLNELFEDIKYRQLTTCDENEFRGLSTANVRACKLRQEFYEITGFDRSRLVTAQMQETLSPSSKKTPDLLQVVVQDTLFKNNETSYSGWSNLDKEVVLSIYNLLKPHCLQGSGNHDNMFIFSKACLRLSPEDKPPVAELDKVVQTWIKRFPDSEWAHLFNYMIHFPIPDGRLAATNSGTLVSIKKCCEMVQRRTGWRARKSAAEYFLGNGTGLAAIVSRQEFPELEKKWRNTKTDFWRSKEVSETLARVRGQKASTGVITYRGIQLRFDDMLYPKESRDDLWFYVGFSVAGPYAYDPVDKDTYSNMTRKAAKKKIAAFPPVNTSNDSGSCALFGVGRRRGRRKPRERNFCSGKPRNLYVKDVKQETTIISAVPSCQEQLSGEPCDGPRVLLNSSPCFRSTVPSPLVSVDNSQGAVCGGRGRRKPDERNIGSGKPRNPDVKDMKQGTTIISAAPNCQEQLSSEPCDGPRGLLNSSPCSRSTAPSPLVSDDNSQGAVGRGRGRRKPGERNIGSGKPRNPYVKDMKQGTTIISAAPNCQEQLSSEPCDGPRVLLNSSPCLRSTAPSPLVSDDNSQGPVGRGRGRRIPCERDIGSGKPRNPDVKDMKQEITIISAVPSCQEQLSSEPCDGRRELLNPSPCFRSTALSPLVSDDNSQGAVGRGRGRRILRERNIGSGKQRNPDVKDMKQETTIISAAPSCQEQLSGEPCGGPRGLSNASPCLRSTALSPLVSDDNSQGPVGRGRGRRIPRERDIGSGKPRNPDGRDMKQETTIISDVPSCQEQLSSEPCNGPRGLLGPSPCLRSTALSPLVSDDNSQGAVGRGRGSGRGKLREQNTDSGKPRNPDVKDMKQETTIISAVPSCQEQLSSELCDGPRGLLNSSPCFRSTAPSPLVSDDNSQRPAETSNPLSYASVLKQREASHEWKTVSVRSQQPVATVRQEKEGKWGHKGEEWRNFQVTHVDDKGRLHHGSRVRGADKSVECRIHTNTDYSRGSNRCTFAHSWRGDTIQFVCTKCTEDNKLECKQKNEHEDFIWNLGPYITKAGGIWKETDGKNTSKAK